MKRTQPLSNIMDVQVDQFEQRFVDIFKHAVEGILCIAPNGTVLTANPAAAEMLGYYSPDQLLAEEPGFEQRMFVDPEDRQIFLGTAQGEMITLECRLYRKDGSTLWVSMKARAVRDASGRLAYYEQYLYDITAQKHIEEAIELSQTRYRALIENAVCAIYRTTLDGRFVEVNHALVTLLGYQSREELMAVNVESDVYADPGARRRLIEQFGNVERFGGVSVLWKRKNGSPVRVRLSGRKTRDASGVLDGFEVIAEQMQGPQRV